MSVKMYLLDKDIDYVAKPKSWLEISIYKDKNRALSS